VGRFWPRRPNTGDQFASKWCGAETTASTTTFMRQMRRRERRCSAERILTVYTGSAASDRSVAESEPLAIIVAVDSRDPARRSEHGEQCAEKRRLERALYQRGEHALRHFLVRACELRQRRRDRERVQ
jgi:hypothetical protein